MRHSSGLLHAAVGFLLLVAAAPLSAQSTATTNGAAGVWVFPERIMEMSGGGSTRELREAEAHLTLEVRGDSVFGTYVITGSTRASRPVQMRGMVNGNSIRLQSEPRTATLRSENGDRTVQTTQEYVLTVNGDDITGTIHTQASEGNVQIPAREIKGKRKV